MRPLANMEYLETVLRRSLSNINTHFLDTEDLLEIRLLLELPQWNVLHLNRAFSQVKRNGW